MRRISPLLFTLVLLVFGVLMLSPSKSRAIGVDATASPYPTYTLYPTYTPIAGQSVNGAPNLTPTLAALPIVNGYGTQAKPVPIGSAIRIPVGQKQIELGISKVVRGAGADQILQAAYSVNAPAQNGYEHIVAFVLVKYISTTNNTLLQIVSYKTVSSKAQDYTNDAAVPPDPALSDVQLYPGGLGGGWITGIVSKDDPAPLIRISPNITDNWFFAITGQ